VNLYHYSDRIIKKVRTSDISLKGKTDFKPNGFWVSVDDPDEDGEPWGWPAWCEAEGYGIGRVKHMVSINDSERILLITNESDLMWFDKVFGINARYGRKIDWILVAKQFAGIVIAPYQFSPCSDLRWYSGWDCASGVIWDASVVHGIEVVK